MTDVTWELGMLDGEVVEDLHIGIMSGLLQFCAISINDITGRFMILDLSNPPKISKMVREEFDTAELAKKFVENI